MLLGGQLRRPLLELWLGCNINCTTVRSILLLVSVLHCAVLVKLDQGYQLPGDKLPWAYGADGSALYWDTGTGSRLIKVITAHACQYASHVPMWSVPMRRRRQYARTSR